MAITVTARGTATSSSAGSVSTSAFTPANASIIVAIGFMFDIASTGATLTFSDSFADTGGGTWTAIDTNAAMNSFGDTARLRAYYRKIGTSPGSHTVTATGNAGAPDEIALIVAEVNGFYAPAPVPQHTASNSQVATFTNTLGLTPDAASVVFSALLDQGGATPGTPTNHTSLFNAAVGTDGLSVSYDITSASASAAYSSLDITGPNQGLIFEITATPSTAVPGFSLTDTFGGTGGTAWAKAVGVTGDGAEVDIWYRFIGTGPSSGAVTATAAVSSPGREMSVLEVKNRNTTQPLRPNQVATATVTTAGETVQLPAVPINDSVVVAATISRGDGSAPGTPAAHTSVVNLSTGGDGYQTSYQELSALQSVAYTGLATTRNLGAMAEFQTQVVTPPPSGGFRLFADSSPWNTPKIPGTTYPWYTPADQTLANSTYGINNGPGYFTPFFRSQPADPVTHFAIGAGWNNGSPWSYDGPAPSSMVRPGGGDGNLDVAFPNGDLLDLYQAGGGGTSWTAGMGVLSNWRTGSGFSTPGPGPAAGTTAIGCVQAGGGIIADDIANGSINHALRIAFDYSALGGAGAGGPGAWCGYAYGRNDDGGGPGPLSEGMFLMVDGTEPAGLPYWGHQLWVTLSTYGAYITDKLDGNPLLFGDGTTAVTNAFGYYYDQGFINTVCRRLRATHFGW